MRETSRSLICVDTCVTVHQATRFGMSRDTKASFLSPPLTCACPQPPRRRQTQGRGGRPCLFSCRKEGGREEGRREGHRFLVSSEASSSRQRGRPRTVHLPCGDSVTPPHFPQTARSTDRDSAGAMLCSKSFAAHLSRDAQLAVVIKGR